MWPKRIILLPAVALLLFLGIYSWNQNTGVLDDLADSSGLEVIGAVLRSTDYVRSTLSDTWYRYVNLVNVREENDRLRSHLLVMQNRLILAAEERAELKRLREMLSLDTPERWPVSAARVIGGRMGSNSIMNTIMISRGFMTGASPDTPVINEAGVIGRVLRAGPATGTVLLLTDPGSRIAVIGQDSRTQGMVVGRGAAAPLELVFIPHNSELRVHEILVTSGLDGIYPKGIPVGIITRVELVDDAPEPLIEVTSLVDFARLEEVMLLERPLRQDVMAPEAAEELIEPDIPFPLSEPAP